jgi:cytochrome d ubiquinol oxidase subunit II
LKTTGDIRAKAHALARKFWIPTVVLVFGFVIFGYFDTDMFSKLGISPGVSPVIAGIALLMTGWFLRNNKSGWAFIMTGLTIIFATITIFFGLYPRVMVSSLNDAWSLTIYNASSTPYTLTVMSIVAAIFVPVVLIYQGWTYWVFKRRVSTDSEIEY